jgi:molybdopterin converting factor subunit 1
MKITVLFFATLRDYAGIKSIELDLAPETTVQGLKRHLAKNYPKLTEPMKTVLVAINHEFGFDENVIPDGAEVAMFPPVSGG